MVPTGATTYTYSNGSNVVSPTATTDYTVTGTDANGCVSSVGAVSTVTVNALPTVSVNSGAICTGASFTMVATGATTYTYSNGSDVVTPTATADYTVTGTDVNGCENTAVSTVTVNALPTVSVNSGAICTGSSFTITPTGALTYTYSNGTGVITPTATADYTVTGTDANGCENTAVSTVSVNTLPTITAVSSSTLLCVGETSTLTATGALTYEWDNGNTGSVIAVSPTVTTDYTVTGTDANGCSNTAVVSQSVSPCTGIQTVTSKDVMVVVSPNPNKGVFNVKVTEGTLTNVSVIDITGRTIVSTVVNSDNTLLDITQYAEGVYYVVVKTTIGTSIKKVIKN